MISRGHQFGMQSKESGEIGPQAHVGCVKGQARRSDAGMRPKWWIAGPLAHPRRSLQTPGQESPVAESAQNPSLETLVATIVRQVLAEGRQTFDEPPRAPRTPFVHSPMPGLNRLAFPERVARLTGATPSRIGIGRAGLRYPTATYLTLRADHAFAKDAVVSEPSKEFLATLGAIELRTQAADLETFLLYPDHGRVLDEASLLRLRNEGTRNVDVQIILADGLSAWAAEMNRGLLPELQRALSQANFTHGKPIWVHRARIAVADQIGVELGAKGTLICLGERPGLGTGDSLSIYLAWAPKMAQDNAEKNCISNVRPAGFKVQDAANQAAEILTRARELGAGGLAIGRIPARTW